MSCADKRQTIDTHNRLSIAVSGRLAFLAILATIIMSIIVTTTTTTTTTIIIIINNNIVVVVGAITTSGSNCF
jgi:hypothetical protein